MTNERKQIANADRRAVPGAVTRPPGSRERRRERDERLQRDAVIQAEVRRLAHALRPYGVLHRNALERAADAVRWHHGGFDSALDAGVRSGLLKRLPAGFYRIADPDREQVGDSGAPPDGQSQEARVRASRRRANAERREAESERREAK